MEPQFTKVTIVALGKFTPQAYNPIALGAARVVPENEVSRATVMAWVAGQFVEFVLPWARVFVDNDRFQVVTEVAPYVRICDFITKALSDLTTPFQLNSFGINFECHFDFGSEAARDELGKRLGPPTAWGSWGKKILSNMHGSAKENPLHGGLAAITMRQPFVLRVEGPRIIGWLDVAIGTSSRIPNTGIFCRTNHHHELARPEKEGSAEDEVLDRNQAMLAALAGGFDESVSSSERIIREAVEQ